MFGNLPADPSTWGTAEITQLITNIILLALTIAGGIAVIYILIGAFSYLTAYGNEEKATQGKKTVMWAIIGLIVLLVSRVIITSIWGAVTGDDINFLIP